MIRNQSPRPGAPLRSWGLEQLKGILAEIKRLDGLRVAPPLGLRRTPSGRVISLSRPQGFYAVLQGNANPYGYTESVATPAGWIAGPRTGSDAYEANGATGLDGERVWLLPSTVPDKRFAFVRTGCIGSLCIYWYSPCTGETDCSRKRNELIATVTLDGQVVGTTAPQPGIDPVSKPCVPISKPGTYVITPGANPNLGGFPSPIFDPPSVTLQVDDPCQDYEVCFRVEPRATGSLLLTIFACGDNGPPRLPQGITVTIAGPAAPIVLQGPQFASQITLPALGQYTVTITGRRYQTQTLTFEVDACNPLARILTSLEPAAGYVCTCACNEPLSRQMALTDSLTGASGPLVWDDAAGLWLALLTGTAPGGHTAPGNCAVTCAPFPGAPISYALWPCAANSDINPSPNPQTACVIAWGQATGPYPITDDPAVVADCARLGFILGGVGCPNGSDPTVLGNVISGFSAAATPNGSPPPPAVTVCPVGQNDTFLFQGTYIVCPFATTLGPGCTETPAAPTGGTITITEVLPP